MKLQKNSNVMSDSFKIGHCSNLTTLPRAVLLPMFMMFNGMNSGYFGQNTLVNGSFKKVLKITRELRSRKNCPSVSL